MRRLRNKVIAFIVLILAAGIGGTAFFATRTFVEDKKSYVAELNASAAPNIALSIGKELDHLQDQLSVVDEILGNSSISAGKVPPALQTAIQKLQDVTELDIYQSHALLLRIVPIATAGQPARPALATADVARANSARGRLLLRSPLDGAIGVSSHIGARLYIAWISPSLFSPYFEMARALQVNLVSQDGSVLAGRQTASPGEALAPELITELAKAVGARDRQAVISRELSVSGGPAISAALAPVPGTGNAWILVRVPLAAASEMARMIVRSFAPFVVIILVLTIAAGVGFSAQLARPLEELTDATSRIASGDWKVSLKPRSRDEIGRLIRSFSQMSRELAAREEALNRAHEELLRSERLAVLGKFGAGIAHEIKNPLSSILGYAQIVQRRLGEAADETVSKFLGFILDETRRANQIISDLLIFARQKPPVLAPLSAAEVLDYSCEKLQPQVETLGIELRKEIRDGATLVRADRDQLYQVLLNLTANACHALEKRAPGETRRVTLSLAREGSDAVIRVADTGAGIAPENLSRIFEPFFSTKEVGKGSGLGLSLCHGIISQHGGKIDVSSVEGQGTEFRILLPVYQ